MAKKQGEQDAEQEFNFDAEFGSEADDDGADVESAPSDEGQQDDAAAETVEPTQDEPTAEEADSSSEPSGDVDGEDRQEPATEATPEPQPQLITLPDDPEAFGELAGRRVTAAELEKANLLQKLATWGHQGRKIQQEQSKRAQEAAQQAEQPAAAADQQEQQDIRQMILENPKGFAEGLKERYGDSAKKFFKAVGEEHFVEEFPVGAALFGGVMDTIIAQQARLDDQSKIILGIIHQESQRQQVQQISSGRQRMDQTIDAVASEPEGQALKDPEYRKRWINWVLSEDNVVANELGFKDLPVDRVTPTLLRFLHREYVRSRAGHAPTPREQRPRAAQSDAALASAGAGGGSAGGGGSRGEIAEFLREVALDSNF